MPSAVAHPQQRVGRTPDSDHPEGKAVLRAACWVAIVVLAWVIVGRRLDLPSVEEVREYAQHGGALAAPLFVLGYAGLTLVPVPRSALSLIGGALFGWYWGSLFAVLGATIGGIASFGTARALRGSRLLRSARIEGVRLDRVLQETGPLPVLVARLLPVAPFTLTSYASGLTSMRLRDYALGTSIGVVPGSVLFAAAGAHRTDLDRPGILVGLGAAVLVLAVHQMLRRSGRRGVSSSPVRRHERPVV